MHAAPWFGSWEDFWVETLGWSEPLTPHAGSKPLCPGGGRLPSDPHTRTTLARTPSPYGLSAGEARRHHPHLPPSCYNASVSLSRATHPHGVRRLVSSPPACTFGSSCLPGSRRLTYEKSRATPCKLRNGRVRLLSEEERRAGSRE